MRVIDVPSRVAKRSLSAWIGHASSRSRRVQPRSLSRLSLTWIGRYFLRFTRECVVFLCVTLRVSLTSDVARRCGSFARTRGRRRYRSFFRRIRVAPFVVVVVFRFSQSLPLDRRDLAFPLSRHIFSAYPSSFSCRVASYCLLVSRAVFDFRLSCSLCVSVFRRGASFSFGFPSSYVVLRPVRLRSLARSLILVFAPSLVFVRCAS